MNSIRQMTDLKVIKRADSEKIEIEQLHFEDDFNPPGRNNEADEKDEALFQHIMRSGISQLPQWEVRPREPEGVFVVDGHRRTTQVRRAIAAGLDLRDKKDGKIWIPIKQFIGNDEDRICRIITSNEKKDLKPLQVAFVYKKLRALGRSPQQIADRFTVSRSSVEQHLILADSNSDVQSMVASGEVSAALAVHVARGHGEAAGAVLAEASSKAKASGKKKLTAGAMKAWMAPAKVVRPVLDGARSLVKLLTPEQIAAVRTNEPKMVQFNAQILHGLLESLESLLDAEKRQADRARDKEQACKQESIKE